MLDAQTPAITNAVSDTATTKPRLAELAPLAPTLLTISVMACATTVAGCARNPAQRELHAVRHEVRAVPIHFDPHRYADLRIRRPPAALLAPQPPPDCEFKGAGDEAVDPTTLARLKLEYERRCYQNAEKAVRERLRLLQASVR